MELGWSRRHWKLRRFQGCLPFGRRSLGESRLFRLLGVAELTDSILQTFSYVPSSVNASVSFYPAHSTKAAVANPKRINTPRVKSVKSAAVAVASKAGSVVAAATSTVAEVVESVVAPSPSSSDDIAEDVAVTPSPRVLAAAVATETKPVWSKVHVARGSMPRRG